jgi:hypothetical protein
MAKTKLITLALLILIGSCKNITLGRQEDILWVSKIANPIELNKAVPIKLAVTIGVTQDDLAGKTISIIAYSRKFCTFEASNPPLSSISEINELTLDSRLSFSHLGATKTNGKSFVVTPQKDSEKTFVADLTMTATVEVDTCLVFRAYNANLTNVDEFNRAEVAYIRVFTPQGVQ